MLFTKGSYRHESGFMVLVADNGTVMLSPNHPLSLRLSEIFDESKWTKVEEKE